MRILSPLMDEEESTEEEEEPEPEDLPSEEPEETLEPLEVEKPEIPEIPDVSAIWCDCAEKEGEDRSVCEGIWDGFKRGDIGQEETKDLLRDQFGVDIVEKISEEVNLLLNLPAEPAVEGDEDET